MTTQEAQVDEPIPAFYVFLIGLIFNSMAYQALFHGAFFVHGHFYFNADIGVAINAQGELFVDRALLFACGPGIILMFMSPLAFCGWLLVLGAQAISRELRPLFPLRENLLNWSFLILAICTSVLWVNLPDVHSLGTSRLDKDRMSITPGKITPHQKGDVS